MPVKALRLFNRMPQSLSNLIRIQVIPALLEGFLGSKRWVAAQIGKIGGATKSQAKTAAARENGKLGGRPKKKKELATA